jgi:hypothetical protein
MEILIPLEGESLTGLQAKELMGLTVNSVNELSDSDAKSFKDFYSELYGRAVRRLEMDVQKILSGFYRFDDGQVVRGRFNFNAKFQTVLTSEFTPGIGSITPAIRVQSFLSMYSAIVVNYVEVNCLQTSGNSQTILIKLTDNNTGLQLTKTFTQSLVIGRNQFPLMLTIPVRWLDFTVSIEIIGSPSEIDLSNTTQLLSNGSSFFSKGWCRCQCGSSGWIGIYQQSSGLNVSLTGVCSIPRFIELNVSLFKYALLYSIGVEYMKDRVATDRVNEYTVLTVERADQLMDLYEKDYLAALDTLRDIRSIPEDFDCFECKRELSTVNLLP